DPRSLRKEPGKRDLGGRGLLLHGNRLQPFDQDLIRLPCLGSETRQAISEITLRERGVLIELASQKAPAEWTEWNETNAELLACRQHFPFRLAPPQRVLALQRSDGMHRVGATYGLHSGFGEAEMPDFTLTDQILDGSGDVFHGNVRVNTMLIEQIDPVSLQPLQGSICYSADVLGAA